MKIVGDKSRLGQVWVETIVYTLIALALIGLFITFAKPKVEEIQDKSIVEQSVEILEEINSIILTMVQGGSGNQRALELGVKKGFFMIDSVNDQLSFEIDGKYVYTEPGEDGQPGESVKVGNVLASTKNQGKTSIVTLISDYDNMYNISYNGGEEKRSISRAPTPYKILISYKGDSGGEPIIDFIIQ
ncbi:MAG: hypothetical protein KKB31_03390 [Nanoarchaeota archaeon]|nr:hypothetical protein [Nanoarchaeota archaeon]